MSTQEINGKTYTVNNVSDGTIIFTPVVEEVKQRTPEERKPEHGDVWLEKDGTNHIVVSSRHGLASAMLENDAFEGCLYSSQFSNDPYKPFEGDFAYLGKFHEVYVNRAEFISDVRAALSHKDNWGDSVLSTVSGGNGIYIGGTITHKTRDALRKLNIITDETQPTK